MSVTGSSRKMLTGRINLRRLERMRDLKRTVNVLRLFSWVRHRKCAVPHDKIYGLLGLLDSSYASCLTPDHNLPIPVLFERFARLAIQNSGELNILSMTVTPDYTAGHHMEDLPLWVPDWTLNYNRGLQMICEQWDIRLEYLDYYSASGPSIAYVAPPQDRVLACRHLIVCSIDRMFDQETILPTDNFSRDCASAAWEFLPEGSTVYATGDGTTVTEAWQRTICADIAFVRDRERIRDKTEFLRYFNAWWNLHQSGAPGMKEASEIYIPAFHSNFMQAWQGRTCFVSDGPGWIGLVPLHAEPGDVIVLLAGGRVPYVVRPRQQYRDEYGVMQKAYDFIGDAYVHGIMEGEAWDEEKLSDAYIY